MGRGKMNSETRKTLVYNFTKGILPLFNWKNGSQGWLTRVRWSDGWEGWRQRVADGLFSNMPDFVGVAILVTSHDANSVSDCLKFVAAILDLENNKIRCCPNNSLLSFQLLIGYCPYKRALLLVTSSRSPLNEKASRLSIYMLYWWAASFPYFWSNLTIK